VVGEMRLKTTFRFRNLMFLVHVQSITVPRTGTVGISARVPYTVKYVIYKDYDNIKDERLVEEEIVMQENVPGHLGDSHVFATSEYGRHVVCIDMLPFREVREIIYASTCDHDYKWGYRINEYRTWILRCFEKGERDRPKYLYSIPSPYNGLRLQSRAHGLFLRYFYGADVRLTNPDGNTELEFQSYKTSSKVKLEDLIKKHKPSIKVKPEDVKKEAKMVQRG
jgi:hypothetical protein